VNESGARGTILNMASVLAFSPEPKFFATHAYAASKSAIIGLTRAMAAYYGPHKVRVNAIAPALTRTPMSARAQQNTEILEFIRAKQPLSEDLIEAEDVARAAVFLLSDESRYITGEVMTVDAGWRLY
jgi:NAD(P)-dependent dehydrogenase (short-subunit alcohol dehydrogenase family)